METARNRMPADTVAPARRHLTELPANELEKPSYGAAQSDAVNSMVTSLSTDLCGKIAELMTILKELEQQLLESAAQSKVSLQGHVRTCVRVNDEITHMRAVVDELKAQAPRASA